MSAKKTILNEQEIKRFAKLSGVKITPELLNERQPTVEDAIVRGGGTPVPDRGTVGAAVAAANDPTAADAMVRGGAAPIKEPKKGTDAKPSSWWTDTQGDTDAKPKKGKVVTDNPDENRWPEMETTWGQWAGAARDKLTRKLRGLTGNRADTTPRSPETWARMRALEKDGADAVDPVRLGDFRGKTDRPKTDYAALKPAGRRGGRRGGRRSRGLNKLQNAGFKNYGDFYKALDDKGMTGLLGKSGADKKFGKGHAKALAALQNQTGFDPKGDRFAASKSGGPAWDQQPEFVTPAPGRKPSKNRQLQNVAAMKDDPVADAAFNATRAERESFLSPSAGPPAPAAPSRPGFTSSGARDYDKGSWQGGKWKTNPMQENKGFSSQEEELIQTLTERILIKYFKK